RDAPPARAANDSNAPPIDHVLPVKASTCALQHSSKDPPLAPPPLPAPAEAASPHTPHSGTNPRAPPQRPFFQNRPLDGSPQNALGGTRITVPTLPPLDPLRSPRLSPILRRPYSPPRREPGRSSAPMGCTT